MIKDNLKDETANSTNTVLAEVKQMPIYEIKNLLLFYRLIPIFKKDGHNVDSNWIINFKVNFLWKQSLGFDCSYKFGYFFWSKSYEVFV